MNPTCSQYTVGETPVLVVNDETAPTGAREDGRITYEIFNNGPDQAYVGGSTVMAATGAPLPAGAARTMAVRLRAQVWVCTDAGASADIRVLQVP